MTKQAVPVESLDWWLFPLIHSLGQLPRFCLNGRTANRKHPKWRNRTFDRESDGRFWIGKPGFLFEFPINHTSISLRTDRETDGRTTRTITIAGLKTSRSLIFSSCWYEPSHVRALFAVINRSRLALNQRTTSVTQNGQSCNSCWCFVNWRADVGYTWQLSAYWCSCRRWWSMTVLMSAVYKLKVAGPKLSLVEHHIIDVEWRSTDHCKDFLCPVGQERHQPSQDDFCKTEVLLQALQEEIMIDAVERSWHIEETEQRHSSTMGSRQHDTKTRSTAVSVEWWRR